MLVSKHELFAWAAGLFEGEGTVTVSKNKRKAYGTFKYNYNLRAFVTNTDKQIIRVFDWCGCWLGTVHEVGQGNGFNIKPCYRWVVCGKQAAQFLRDIQPYLKTDKYKSARYCWTSTAGGQATQGSCR
jgi:hypothetical protein